MEHKPISQLISKSFIGRLYVNKNHVYHLFFFVIGISLGIVATLCFKSLSFSLQAFPYHHVMTTSLTTFFQPPPMPLPSLQAPPPSPPPPPLPSPRPPPPLQVLSSSSWNTTSNYNNTKTSLMHNMTDQELFIKASMVQGIEDFTNKTIIPKVAFMFLVKGKLPLAPLWEKFFKGHAGFYCIYLHQDPSYKDNVREDSVFYGRKVPSQPVVWGTSSMIDAERRLLANALLDFSNQRFVLLSESCIPLFGFTTIYDYLMNSTLSFVHSFYDPTKDCRGRYNPKMWPIINITDWRKGSQWFEVHRDLAIHIISDTKYYPMFQQYCLPRCYTDEHYIPTFVHMMYPELNSNRSVTWVDWSIRGPHPRRYVRDDITDEVLNQIRFGSTCVYNGNTTNICFLFGRKFHPSTLEPLLRESYSLLGIES